MTCVCVCVRGLPRCSCHQAYLYIYLTASCRTLCYHQAPVGWGATQLDGPAQSPQGIANVAVARPHDGGDEQLLQQQRAAAQEDEETSDEREEGEEGEHQHQG